MLSGTNTFAFPIYSEAWRQLMQILTFSASEYSVPHLHEQIAKKSSLCRFWNSRVATMSLRLDRWGLEGPQTWNLGIWCVLKSDLVFQTLRLQVRNLPQAWFYCILAERVQYHPIRLMYTVHRGGKRRLAYSFCEAYPELEVHSAAFSTRKNASQE